MTGIITLPLVPLRAGNSEQSEQTSQLLFGERVEIRETQERWLFVRNLTDDYTGWVDRKMVQCLSIEQAQTLEKASFTCLSVPLSVCKTSLSEQMYLPGGSLLPNYSKGEFTIAGNRFFVNNAPIKGASNSFGVQVVCVALQYLNAPYLWGGKSIMGIDCSGLVQVAFAIAGVVLPRDASQQVNSGADVSSLADVHAGDLAFFENADGRIIHVGILLSNEQIIHASGWVKVETIDSHGIVSGQTGDYTHKLKAIKRISKS